MKQYSAAIIGCGAIGSEMDESGHPLGNQTHAGAYSAADRIDLVAVCDADIGRAALCAQRRRVSKHYSDYSRMLLECSPDVVSVAVPTSIHDRVMRDVLTKTGAQLILCEKPIAENGAKAAELVSLAENRGCTLLVNYSRHYLPAMEKVGRNIREGKIGTIRLVNTLYTKSLLHNGTHLLDLLRWWFGGLEIIDSRRSFWDTEQCGAVDVVLKSKEKFPIYLHALDAADYSVFELEIIGSAGRISITDGGNKVTVRGVEEHTLFAGFQDFEHKPKVLNDCFNNMMSYVVDVALDALEGNKTAIGRCCFGGNGVETLLLAEEAIRMADSKK